MEQATLEDDEVVRALLREIPLEGWVQVTLEREPSYFLGEGLMGPGATLLARTPEGGAIGMCATQGLQGHLNGDPTDLVYWSALRVRPEYRHRIGLVRQGFSAMRGLAHRGVGFTSVGTENRRARRLLEARLPGLPRYTPTGEINTWLLKAEGRPSGRLRPARPSDAAGLAELLNAQAGGYQFSPRLEARWLLELDGSRGLRLGDFWVRDSAGGLEAGLALWDQRCFRQTRVRGYRNPLPLLRPLYNLLAGPLGGLRLPAVGEALDACFLAFAANPDEALLREGLALAAERGIATCLYGLPVGHPLEAVVRRLGPSRVYRTCIETIRWPDEAPLSLDGRLPWPEIALL